MRLIIEADFKIDEIDEEQSKQLEDFSVRFSKDQDSIVIHEQKIDLEMSDMEDFLDVLYWNVENNKKVHLYRYERERYVLKLLD